MYIYGLQRQKHEFQAWISNYPCLRTHFRHQSLNIVIIVNDALTYWFGNIQVITCQYGYWFTIWKALHIQRNKRIDTLGRFIPVAPRLSCIYCSKRRLNILIWKHRVDKYIWEMADIIIGTNDIVYNFSRSRSLLAWSVRHQLNRSLLKIWSLLEL